MNTLNSINNMFCVKKNSSNNNGIATITTNLPYTTYINPTNNISYYIFTANTNKTTYSMNILNESVNQIRSTILAVGGGGAGGATYSNYDSGGGGGGGGAVGIGYYTFNNNTSYDVSINVGLGETFSTTSSVGGKSTIININGTIKTINGGGKGGG